MKLKEKIHNGVINTVDYVIVSPINTLLVAPACYGFKPEDFKLGSKLKWHDLKINNSQITLQVKDGDNIAKKIAKRFINSIPTALQVIAELALKILQLPFFIVGLVARATFEIAKGLYSVGSYAINAMSSKKDDSNSAKKDEVGDSSEDNFVVVEETKESIDVVPPQVVKNTMFGQAKDAVEGYLQACKYPVVASA